ncbi:Phytanoyl-CoA dioxygenase [Penicillium cosmopolitanum]|uniref:Phytanoyl-CoA dioxygenase n=1 Tax=Penicillium cosmopolitanum TaxID=1131564 RepID=A0A9W9VQF6_9EURO|nr:Phytanoyl-CoA dioxygenase [Penicillium cosmopolitanum]KAJ5387284.1 Phytanoyl-CoA dioxygenase [Penicillium cosmopolitanum]
MDNYHYALTQKQLQSFQERGYLLVRSFFTAEEARILQQWAQEVHDLPRTPGVPWMPYEEVNGQGDRVLCRTENFVNSHQGFDSFLRGHRALSTLQQLAGEDMLLFKEKINYKLAGSGGFDPHIDANAYTHVRNIKHLTILAAVDIMNGTNGGLEVVDGSHRMEIPLGKDRCIEPTWVNGHTWTPCDLEPGDILVFGSYLAHRSGANTSSKDRRAIYATYNRAAEGNLHDQYYADRQKLWPATHMRKEGESYEEGRVRYAFGSPMLTVDSSKKELVSAV